MTAVTPSLPLLAVHISDAVLEPAWWLGGWFPAQILVFRALRRIRDEEIPRIGVLTAALFVASQIHLPLGVGSVHLLLNGLAGLLLGRRAPLAIFVAVTLHALLFAHGGVTTIGVNTVVMAVPAIVAAWLFRRAQSRTTRGTFRLGFALGAMTSLATVALNAIVLVFGSVAEWPVVAAIVTAHLPVIAVEAAGTGVIVSYLTKVKPEWLTAEPTAVR